MSNIPTKEVQTLHLHHQIIRARAEFYSRTGREADTVYLGYHEWYTLMLNQNALVYRDSPYTWRYDGANLVMVNKPHHLGIGVSYA